jgi:hypothetical protein
MQPGPSPSGMYSRRLVWSFPFSSMSLGLFTSKVSNSAEGGHISRLDIFETCWTPSGNCQLHPPLNPSFSEIMRSASFARRTVLHAMPAALASFLISLWPTSLEIPRYL